METKYKKNKKGFTIIELLSVMFIIGVMISIGILYIRKSKGGNERHNAANVIVTMIRQAKEIAATANSIYKVNFNTSQMSVKITNQSGVKQYGKTYYLPENVRYPAGKLPPGFIEVRPSGNFNALLKDKIYLEEKNNPGLYDRIDLIEQTGQVKLVKDTKT